MRRTGIGVLSLLLAAAMLLAACGSAPVPPAGQPAPEPTWNLKPDATPEPTPEAGQLISGAAILGAWSPQEGGDFIYEFTEEGLWIVYDGAGAELLRMEYQVAGDLIFSQRMIMRISGAGEQLTLEDTREPYGRFVLSRTEAPAREEGEESTEAPAETPDNSADWRGISKKTFGAVIYVKELKDLAKKGDYYPGRNDQAFVAQITKQAFRFRDEEGFTFPGEKDACCASYALEAYWVNGSREDIPLGAAVYFSGNRDSCPTCGAEDAGHVGVYLGNGQIIHCCAVYENGIRRENRIRIDAMDDILNDWGYRYEGWGWESGYPISQEGILDVKPQIFLDAKPGQYPDTIQEGELFHVSGTVMVDVGVIKTVRGDILDQNGETVVEPKAAEFDAGDRRTYGLDEQIDAALKFGKLEPGRYTYLVTAKAANGKQKSEATLLERSFYVIAKDAPEIRNGRAVREGDSSARITWEACPNAVAYEVQYENPIQKGEWITDSSYSEGTEYVSTGLQKHESWRFRVHAVFADGTFSQWCVIEYKKLA